MDYSRRNTYQIGNPPVYIIMFDISEIKPKLILSPVKAQKFLQLPVIIR